MASGTPVAFLDDDENQEPLSFEFRDITEAGSDLWDLGEISWVSGGIVLRPGFELLGEAGNTVGFSGGGLEGEPDPDATLIDTDDFSTLDASFLLDPVEDVLNFKKSFLLDVEEGALSIRSHLSSGSEKAEA